MRTKCVAGLAGIVLLSGAGACGGGGAGADPVADVAAEAPGDVAEVADVTGDADGTARPDVAEPGAEAEVATDVPPDEVAADAAPDEFATESVEAIDETAGDLDVIPEPLEAMADAPGEPADEAGEEPLPEAVEDPGSEPEPDIAELPPDPAEDAASDTAADTPADEAATGSPWAWCPTAADHVGGDWAGTVDATDTARYCGTFDETRTLEQELAKKVELVFIPGTYALPTATGTSPFTLPFCLRFLDPGTQPMISGPGSLKATVSGTSYSWTWTQPLATAGGEAWVLQASFYGSSASGTPALVLDGLYHGGAGLYALLCKGDCSQYVDQRRISTCVYEGTTLNRHTIVFQGGQAILDLRLGVSMAGTEPGIFWHAEGTLDGVAFTQDDFWHLVYHPAHHHFTRNFAVRFDSPIGAACGVRVDGFDPYTLAATVHTVDCDLGAIESRTLISAKLDRL